MATLGLRGETFLIGLRFELLGIFGFLSISGWSKAFVEVGAEA
jgi:hypothetical protein